jgi:hypothetical protein
MPAIEDIVSEHSQIDPSFKSQRVYVKLTAPYIFKELILKKGFPLGSFCVRTLNNVLNRAGYTLKKVLKTQPLKKLPQTDAIFENVAQQHAKAASNPRILRISIDTKAKVKVGNLSRGGYSRAKQAPKTDDHDQKWDAVLVPFGIYELNTDTVFLNFGNSSETADFIVDALEKWWQDRAFMPDEYDSLMIDLDNGQSVASSTKLFINRMVSFAQTINKPIQLVYYPPYHSKYNPIERVWAALENYWQSLVLDSVENTLKIAAQMTWKGVNPIVDLIDKVYQKGVKVQAEDVNQLSPFVIRNQSLNKWNVQILNTING